MRLHFVFFVFKSTNAISLSSKPGVGLTSMVAPFFAKVSNSDCMFFTSKHKWWTPPPDLANSLIGEFGDAGSINSKNG